MFIKKHPVLAKSIFNEFLTQLGRQVDQIINLEEDQLNNDTFDVFCDNFILFVNPKVSTFKGLEKAVLIIEVFEELLNKINRGSSVGIYHLLEEKLLLKIHLNLGFDIEKLTIPDDILEDINVNILTIREELFNNRYKPLIINTVKKNAESPLEINKMLIDLYKDMQVIEQFEITDTTEIISDIIIKLKLPSIYLSQVQEILCYSLAKCLIKGDEKQYLKKHISLRLLREAFLQKLEDNKYKSNISTLSKAWMDALEYLYQTEYSLEELNSDTFDLDSEIFTKEEEAIYMKIATSLNESAVSNMYLTSRLIFTGYVTEFLPWIPDLMNHKKLKGKALTTSKFIVLAYFLKYCLNQNDGIEKINDTKELSKMFQMSTKSVKNAITDLIKLKYLFNQGTETAPDYIANAVEIFKVLENKTIK